MYKWEQFWGEDLSNRKALFGTAPTPKYNSSSWVWSGVVELTKPSSTTLVYFVKELHPTPLLVLVELKLFGWAPAPGGVELELELCQTGPSLAWLDIIEDSLKDSLS